MRKMMMLASLAALSVSPVVAEDALSCVLDVDGKSYAEGPCQVDRFDGGFQLTDGDFFAYVYGSGEMAFWNEEAGVGRAHSRLGELVQDGSCWVGDRAKVCFTGAEIAPVPETKSSGMTEQTKP